MLPKEVRRETGLTEKAMRLYEEKGLIVPNVREQNGKRLRDYSAADVALLRTIASLRRARFSLEQIGRMLRDPASVPEVFNEYKADLTREAAEIEELLAAVEAVDGASLGDAEALATAITPVAEPMPLPERDRDYRPYRWEEITDEERQAAFEKFWAKQEKRLDRQLFVEAAFAWVGRMTVRVILPLAGIAFLLYNVPAKEEIELLLPAVEYDRESGEVVSTTTVCLSGEIRRYLFKEDYYEGTFEIDGFAPYSRMYANRYGVEHARHSDPFVVQLPLVDRLYTRLYPTESKFMHDLYRDPLLREDSLRDSEYLGAIWLLDADAPFDGFVMDFMEPTSATSWRSGDRKLIAPAGNAEDAAKIWNTLTKIWEEQYAAVEE